MPRIYWNFYVCYFCNKIISFGIFFWWRAFQTVSGRNSYDTRWFLSYSLGWCIDKICSMVGTRLLLLYHRSSREYQNVTQQVYHFWNIFLVFNDSTLIPKKMSYIFCVCRKMLMNEYEMRTEINNLVDVLCMNGWGWFFSGCKYSSSCGLWYIFRSNKEVWFGGAINKILHVAVFAILIRDTFIIGTFIERSFWY